MYRYISRESCSQFDSLPLTSLTIPHPRTGSDYDVFHFIGHGGIPNEIGEMTLAFKAKKAARGAARGDAAEGGGSRSGARESGRPGDGEASLCTHDTIVRMLRSAAKERSLKVAVLMACNTRAIATQTPTPRASPPPRPWQG